MFKSIVSVFSQLRGCSLVFCLVVSTLIMSDISLLAQNQYAWVQKSSLPAIGRHRASACAIGSRGYLGLGHYNVNGEVVFGDWWEYDPGSDTWTQKANIGGAARFGAVTFTIGMFAYVVAGDAGSSLLNDMWRYDPVLNVWTMMSQFPGQATGKAVGISVGTKAYVGLENAANTWWQYDAITNAWSSRSSFPGLQRNFSAVFQSVT